MLPDVLALLDSPTLRFLASGCALVLVVYWILLGVDALVDRQDATTRSAP